MGISSEELRELSKLGRMKVELGRLSVELGKICVALGKVSAKLESKCEIREGKCEIWESKCEIWESKSEIRENYLLNLVENILHGEVRVELGRVSLEEFFSPDYPLRCAIKHFWCSCISEAGCTDCTIRSSVKR